MVFDAAETRPPLVHRPRGVRVLFSPAGVIADDVIRELVAAEPAGRAVVVVTSDRPRSPTCDVRWRPCVGGAGAAAAREAGAATSRG